MHALVFAAGRGTRLRPYTDRTPKPLLEISGEPLLGRTLRSVVNAGVDEIVIVVGYRAGDVIDTIGTAIDGVPIRYAVQDDRQGLAHAVCVAFEDGYGIAAPEEINESGDGPAPADVLTINGDNVFDSDCDLSRLVERHRDPGVDGTLLLDRVARNEAETTARCVLDDDGTVRSVESSASEPESGYLAGGVQTHDARTLFEACRAVDRGDSGEYELADALEGLIADGSRYVGIELAGWHLNVNTPADLERARRYFGADDSIR
ncbi:nucleotidyltransferase family protein [Natronorubrum sp. DTA28]|uniref:nucleotidyltransferase family protein n=1 Tax=Natronorubrum sp. DTA28 TaxID=3447019 RepID=UPI003F83EF20